MSFVYVCHCLTPHKCFKLLTLSWLTSLLISSLYPPPLTWFCYKGLCCCAYLLLIRACLDKPISHLDWEGLKKKLVHFPFQSTYIGGESVYPSKPLVCFFGFESDKCVCWCKSYDFIQLMGIPVHKDIGLKCKLYISLQISGHMAFLCSPRNDPFICLVKPQCNTSLVLLSIDECLVCFCLYVCRLHTRPNW